MLSRDDNTEPLNDHRLFREDVPDLLEQDGDFLLRKEQVKKGLLVAALSVRSDGVVKHFVINRSDQGDFYIEKLRAKTIEELVQSHLESGEPLSRASQAVLKRPVPRQEWMLNHEDIVFKQVSLGRHHSVEEFIGEFIVNDVTRPAFLKTIGVSSSREVRSRLMKEARLLRSLRHQNVGEIYGVALHYSPIILVLEFFSLAPHWNSAKLMHSESLHTYLKQNAGRLPDEEKRRLVCETAAGLAYLAENNCIHRDIAARNCKLNDALVKPLVNSTTPTVSTRALQEVKISGFSLCEPTREMHDVSNMHMAVKWQAPEVLRDRNFSLKSDVWSFGVLMWEVYSDGAEPYGGMTPSVAKNVILDNEFRMQIPKDCPEVIAKIMASCWETFPRKRPCMQAIHLVIRDY
ncbi:SH2 domain protein [Ancylostoma duodenale]|uniref:Tyrosine-protein kinase n=1 Tax=Ancylostoma duodenale TaxID=51022 RepID=A0A0C2DED5_9BILA|nr:SH2 domain protein [Ancylostoma duodenale]